MCGKDGTLAKRIIITPYTHIMHIDFFHTILQQFNLFAHTHTHTQKNVRFFFIDGITHFYQSRHILNICNKSYNVKKFKRINQRR